MSNGNRIEIVNYNTEYFKTIHKLITPGFKLFIPLIPLKSNQEGGFVIGKFHTNSFAILINDLKDFLTDTQINNGTIRLIFDSKATRFDIAILGVIALFNKSFPNIQFEIEIDKDMPERIYYSFRDILLSIRNWYEFSDNVHLYKIYYSGIHRKNMYNEPKGLLPLLLLNKNSYHNYFSDKSDKVNFSNLFASINKNNLKSTITDIFQKTYAEHYKADAKNTKATISEINYRIIRDTIKHFDTTLNWKGNQRAYLQHYILMLSHFDLLIDEIKAIDDLNIDSLAFKHFRKVNLGIEEMTTLQVHIKDICFKLSEEPYFLTILFSVLVNRNLDNQIKNVTNFNKRLDELYEYSYNLFLGIKEIARNIVDHTETKQGILCGRVTTGQNIYQTNNDIENINSVSSLDDYFDGLNKKKSIPKTKNILKEAFFQISIFDEGQKGLIQKTIDNIKFLVKNINDPEHFFTKDINELESGNIKLNNFFDTKEFKLFHQTYKATSHWGLVSFTNLITKNGGYIAVSSKSYLKKGNYDNCVVYSDKTTAVKIKGGCFGLGTKYEIILPISKTIELSKSKLSNVAPKGINFTTAGYLDLFNYKYISHIDQNIDTTKIYLLNFKIIDFWKTSNVDDYRKEYDIARLLGNSLKSIVQTFSNIIPVLDFEETSGYIDHSKLLRLLGSLQLEIEIESLIVINVEINLVKALNNIMNLSDSEIELMPKWNQNHFVLLYSFAKNSAGDRIYYTDVLGGATIQEFKLLKNKLSSKHSTVIDYTFSTEGLVFSNETKRSFENSPIFIDNTGIIKNFEMLLSYNGRTFFENSLVYNLNAKIHDDEYGFSGYKIENSHFKLGSKTHIKDFIYAKRIFQNSFFTDRFAFLISNYYISNYPNEKSLTIIGYGEYSQMLVNRIEKILMAYYDTESINHDMVSDIEDPFFIKKEPFNDKILVIVPINTTFSTTIKIEDLITERIANTLFDKTPALIEPSVNLVLVTHNDLENANYVSELNDYLASKDEDKHDIFPYKFFYWKKVNPQEKIITIGTNPKKKAQKNQRYFITIKSEWYLPDKCESCFPKWTKLDSDKFGIYHEKPLLETDKTSVTPDLLLDLPFSYSEQNNLKTSENIIKINNSEFSDWVPENQYEIFINDACHKAKHLKYKGDHHLHFIEPLPFFKIYKTQIEQWANRIRKRLQTSIPSLFSSSILLISPSERNNTYFVELINRKIFDDSGIIIHYEVTGDYTENYQKFFSANIKQSNYIFYVDDFIQSGRTFHQVNDFIRYCNNQQGYEIKKRTFNKSCDGVFTLISKTDNYTKSDIISQINSVDGIEDEHKFNSFYYLHIANFSLDKCPLCKEQERYKALADISMLDTIKYYFMNKSKNLEVVDINSYTENESGWLKYHPFVYESKEFPWLENISGSSKRIYFHFCNEKIPDRNYLKLLIQNELNRLLSLNLEIRKLFEYPFDDFSIDGKIDHTNKLFSTILTELKAINPFKSWYSKFDDDILKIYDSILEELLIKIITLQPFSNIKCIKEKSFFWVIHKLEISLNSYIEEKKLSFRKFRYIKFLLRRATLLGSNYIIRMQSLLKFQEIFSIYTPDVKAKTENKRLEKIKKLNETFICILAEESVVKDELLKYERNLSITTLSSFDIIYSLKERLKDIANKKKYIIQSLRNIQYVDISLKEFSYFFVSLVKEVTAFNDSKVLKLEQNVDNILDKLGQNNLSDFYFLLRLLKLENAFIIKNAIELIFNETLKHNKLLYFNNKFSSVSVRAAIDGGISDIIEDYRLYAFRIYYKIDNFSSWKISHSLEYNYLMELIYLYACLVHEKDNDFEKPIDYKLSDKTKTIVRNIFRISGDSANSDTKISLKEDLVYNSRAENGAFLVLKTSDEVDAETTPNHLLVAYATEPYKIEDDFKIYNTPFDKYSLSLLMFKGLNSRNDIMTENIKDVIDWINSQSNFEKSNAIVSEYPKKPWTIWELAKTSDTTSPSWISVRGKIFLIGSSEISASSLNYTKSGDLRITDEFTEGLYLAEDINSLAFIRLSNIALKKDVLRNDGEAVICLFSSSKSLNINRLKLILPVLPLVTEFIIKHYDSDSLNAFIQERNEKLEVERLKHGFQIYLDNLKSVALDLDNSDNKIELVKIIYSLLIPWRSLKASINAYKRYLDSGLTKEDKADDYQTIEIKSIFAKIESHFTIIVKNEIGGQNRAHENSIILCRPIYELKEDTTINISATLLDIILGEALLNAKKYCIPSTHYILLCKFYKTAENLVMLELSNNSGINDPRFIKLLNKYNSKSKKGLGLLNNISVELFGRNILIESKILSNLPSDFPKEIEYFFSVAIPISKV